MRDQQIVSLWEAYNGIYEKETNTYDNWGEEVEIAAEYFYEMGLNEYGVDILIKELGVSGFAEFVYDISEEYVLTEARAGGARIEPKLSSGKPIQGKPKAASLKALRKQKAARQEAENKASESKPSGMKASLKRQSAVAAAAKKQPKKPGLLNRIAGAVNRGIERHNAANKSLSKAASETGKTLSKVGKAASTVAKGVASGVSGSAKLAGHVARKGLNDEYIMEYLIDEGYAETPEAAEKIMVNMSEEWRESIVEESMPPRRSKEERSKRAKELGDRQTIRNVVGKYNKEKPLSKQENPDKYYSNN
jgi:hypothetical protein